jgi:hypothetical protein
MDVSEAQDDRKTDKHRKAMTAEKFIHEEHKGHE